MQVLVLFTNLLPFPFPRRDMKPCWRVRRATGQGELKVIFARISTSFLTHNVRFIHMHTLVALDVYICSRLVHQYLMSLSSWAFQPGSCCYCAYEFRRITHTT